MVDIALYGNLVLDTIFENFQSRQDLGGIANVWKSIKIQSTSTVQIIPITIGSAIIYIDSEVGSKYAKPNLIEHYQVPTIVKSKISHIAYLNQLPNLEFVKNIKSNITCADLAGTKSFDYSVLQYIDYLFIAHDEVSNLGDIMKHIKGNVIVHNPNGSTFYSNELKSQFKFYHSSIKNVNVLGAGDHLAASFMLNKLKKLNDIDAIKLAHESTIEFLKKNN
jgi:bifunctional ADP-heptose synthase (sugar kinase/adenylyltransferase)